LSDFFILVIRLTSE